MFGFVRHKKLQVTLDLIFGHINRTNDRINMMSERIVKLEKHSHVPYDFTEMENRLKALELITGARVQPKRKSKAIKVSND